MANAKRVLFRKGTTAEHKNFAGARAEITVDIDRNIAIVHDGTTQGGYELVGVAATGQSIVNKDAIGIGTSNATSELTVFGSCYITGVSTFSNTFNIGIGGTVLTTFGNSIGIGTANPTSKLTVGGDVKVSGVVTATTFSGTATNSSALNSLSDTSFLRSDVADQKTSGTLTFNDSILLTFGTGDDAEFFCDGSNFYLDLNSTGVSDWFVRDGTTTRFTFNRTGGNFTATGTVSDSKGDVRTAPVNNRTSSYDLVVADAGKLITTNSGVTVPSSVFSPGEMITIINSGTSNITITQGSGVTMYQAVSSQTGNRTLPAKGICTLICYASNTFLISGAGLT